VRNTIFADKIVRIKIIGEDFATFFFIAKLYDRVFQQAGPFLETTLLMVLCMSL